MKYIRHLLELRWGYCHDCKHWRTNMVGHANSLKHARWCGYCDFMDAQ